MPRIKSAVVIIAFSVSVAAIGAQTVVKPPDNKYTPAQDVELGRSAAAEVEQQLPVLRDSEVKSPITSIGRRLVDAVPQELQHPEFRYSFDVINVREINAFALPGGPMYLNRGMIEAAKNEGEAAGVMAHELSHVVLRHGTAQASKATKYQVGQLLGAVLGSIIGGNVGSVVAQGTQFGLGVAFLRFSREYERQADLLGSHIMARAGYDPRDMANMFKTIEKRGGAGGPEWLSDHPNPGDRYEAITREAKTLQVQNPVDDSPAFKQAQTKLRRMPKAPTTEEVARTAKSGGAPGRPSGRPTGASEPPSSTFTEYTEGDLFRVSVPSNWREVPGSHAVTFAPEGAYGTENGEASFTHGMQIGIARNETHDLRTATDELISTLAQGNPNLSRPSSYDRTRIGGRQGFRTLLSNGSGPSGQEEQIAVFTVLLEDKSLFYALGVAPRSQFSVYEGAFRRIVDSIEFRR